MHIPCVTHLSELLVHDTIDNRVTEGVAHHEIHHYQSSFLRDSLHLTWHSG